jgi:anti-anti-sigma regulatory factor
MAGSSYQNNNMAITIKSSLDAEDFLLELSGHLDESVEFPDVTLRLSQRVIIDCKTVSHINSYAAQMWSKWMKDKDPRQQFVFRNIPPRIVNKFNLIDGFLPSESTIESFYVPYECDNCEHEELVLAERGRDFIESQNENPAKLLLAEEINCPKCKSGMKLGIWETKYLRFLNPFQG